MGVLKHSLVSIPMAQTPQSTRNRILAAANQLFYGEGIRATSVDAIAEKAGVTKKTVYYHFKSKDDLVAGYLESRDQPNLALFERWFDESNGTLADKIASIFSHVADGGRHPKWKGCGFQRTVAELANMPGHPAVKIGAAHKKKFEAWLGDRFAKAGIAHPPVLARHIIILMEGAFSTMLMHREPDYADAAADAARAMVSAAIARMNVT